MTGNSSIDISLANVWRSFVAFRKGKKPSRAITEFEYELLDNILKLATELQAGTYRHGPYSHMIVNDNKRRDIAVASVRDRVVHRLLYDYLVTIWDKTFIYDAWSCRQNKGLHGAIDRAQKFMRQHKDGWLWRGDVTKLFDSVDKNTLLRLLRRRVSDPTALWLLSETIESYHSFDNNRGIPIGNLTSQILANIYLNEFDRYITHRIKPNAHLRYGDDWLCFMDDKAKLENARKKAEDFLRCELNLDVNPNVNLINPVRKGVSYLGVDLWSSGRRLDKDAQNKMKRNLNVRNVASYKALMVHNQSIKQIRRFDWIIQSINEP